MKKILFALVAVFVFAGGAFAYPVAYNTNSGIYHSRSCTWAHKCTKNCINIDHKDAIRRGGRPCKVCGG